MTPVENLQNALTICPGEHTGWAYWNGGEVPAEVGQFNSIIPKTAKTLDCQLKQMREEFSLLTLKFTDLKHVYVEGIELLNSNIISANALKRGKLQKLSYRIDVFSKICQELSIDFTVISANRWKGQIGDDEVSLQVYRSIQQYYPQTLITNSVGLGLSIMGRL